MGSGSIGVAAEREGFGYIGIELDADYHAIAERRMAAKPADPGIFPTSPPPMTTRCRRHAVEPNEYPLFAGIKD